MAGIHALDLEVLRRGCMFSQTGNTSTITSVYECTATGTIFGNTIWEGNAFRCPLEEIILQHHHFLEAYGVCNGGSIVERSLRVENETYYISQLNVTISSDLVGKSIKCFYDDNTGMRQLVGALNITDSESKKLAVLAINIVNMHYFLS